MKKSQKNVQLVDVTLHGNERRWLRLKISTSFIKEFNQSPIEMTGEIVDERSQKYRLLPGLQSKPTPSQNLPQKQNFFREPALIDCD